MTAAPHWKRSQLAIVVSTFAFFSGTNFLLPFIPLYVQELDDLNFQQTAAWSGLILAAGPLVSGIVTPFWGILTDRWGPKVILLRSLAGFSLTLGLMGIAQSAWQLLLIRILTGVFAGYSGTAAAFISANNPRDQLTAGIGKVNAARILGTAVGPLPGGVLADLIGFRHTCFVSMGMALAAFTLVLFMAKEERRPDRGRKPAQQERARVVLANPPFLSSVSVVFIVRMIERTFEPLLPLLIAYYGTQGIGVATATAIIVSSGQFASAAFSAWAGRVVPRNYRNRGLRLTLYATGVALLGVLVSSSWVHLLLVRLVVGVAAGLSSTLIYSATARETPENRRGLALSVLSTGMSFGGAAGFMLAGALSAVWMFLVFAVDAVTIAGVAVAHRLARRRPRPPDSPERPGPPGSAGP